MHRLAHRERQADQLERDINASAARHFSKLRDRVSLGRINRNGSKPCREPELFRIDVNGENLRRAEIKSDLDRGNAQAAHAENGDRLAGAQTSFVQRVQRSR